jgi:putative zinc finger/helix-turn-helix YgiT family protein
MNCPSCDGKMRVAKENFNYSSCGLPYITLQNVEVRRCEECGEDEVVIPKIDLLHQAIATSLIAKRNRLTAAEVRFLRKYLGWSGVDFARHMGVAPETVSRWENGREPIGGVAERLLRLMVATRGPARDYALDTLAELEDEAAPTRLKLAVDRTGWHPEAA